MSLSEITLTHGTGAIPTIGLGTWTVLGQQLPAGHRVFMKDCTNKTFLLESYLSPYPTAATSVTRILVLVEKYLNNEGNTEEVEAAIGYAIDVGYRLIDTAWCYGTQESIGKVVERKIKDRVIKRKDIFITTKLWNTHHNPKMVMNELKDSLKKLRTDYVDMFLMHWPIGMGDEDLSGNVIGFDVESETENKTIWTFYPLEDVWKAMEECQLAGLTRNIGLSNFNIKQTERILKCATVKPSNNQIEISPYLINERLTKFCQEKGLAVTAYAPFGAPFSPWRQLQNPTPLEDPVLTEIAKRHGKTVAQVILRFLLQYGVAAVPKSVTPTRIKENIEVFDFELMEEDMKQIKALDKNMRIYAEPILGMKDHPEFPFNEPY